MDKTGKLLPDALKMTIDANPPKSESFISNIALRTAKYYLTVNKPGLALQAADLVVIDERIHFCKSNGFIDECINLLQRTNRLEKLYRFLKGHNKLEEEASIAKKFNNTDEQVMFVLMIIRSKILQNTNHSKETHQKDSENLHVLLKITHDYHLKQQLLFYIELLEGMNDWYNTHINLSVHYLKIKAFDLYLDNLKNYLPHGNVIFKNLRQLLQLHNSDLKESMVKFLMF